MEWSNEMCLQLIDMYEQYPVLWDSSNSFYYSKNKKNYAWLEIAANLNIDVKVIKQKMNSLLGSFRSQKSKGKKAIGTGKADVYVSKWFAFERMQFLLDKDEPRDTIDTETNAEMGNTDGFSQTMQWSVPPAPTGIKTELFLENESESAVASNNPDHDQPPIEDVDEEMTQRSHKQTPLKRPQKRTKEAYKVLQNVRTRYISSKQPSEVPDRFSIYGQHVANKLRLYNRRTEVFVEHHINNILFQADIGTYEGSEHSLSSNQQYSYIPTPMLSPSPNMPSSSYSTTALNVNCPNVTEVCNLVQLGTSASNNMPKPATSSYEIIPKLEGSTT